jgi:small subunit ribosomal protein S1
METQYPVGSMVTGEVRNITNFGIFVGLEEGIDGLVHISDVSWTEQIKHPSDRFEKGDEVKAVVLKIDKENEKFSLGIKQLEPNPWDDIAKKYKVGSEVTGPVTNVTEFGVFVKLEDGIDGLVYSSELGAEKIENPEEHFKVGDDVKSVIVKVDPIEQKISLSIRALTDKTERAALKKVAEQESSSQATTFGDLLKEKMAEKEDASPLDDE